MYQRSIQQGKPRAITCPWLTRRRRAQLGIARSAPPSVLKIAELKFLVDIITQNYPLYSDWLTELPYIFGPDGWLGA